MTGALIPILGERRIGRNTACAEFLHRDRVISLCEIECGLRIVCFRYPLQ